jgi:multidrug efflux pump subunit AcrA (membrane-fusion protein)
MPDLDAPFLNPEPPPWVARALASGMLVLFVIVSIAAFLVHVPETVSGRFVLVPQRGTDPVRALREGVVTRTFASEGDTVGDLAPLFELQSAPIGDRAAGLRSLQTGMAADSTRLTISRSQLETRRRADEGEARRLRSKVEFLTRLIESKTRRYKLARELADSASLGNRQGSVSRYEASRQEFEASTIAEEIQANQDDLADTRAALQRLEDDGRARELEFQETRRGLQESIETAHIRIEALRTDLGNSTGSGLTVRTPCRGTVLRLQVAMPGAVVREGDVMAEVACAGEHLLGELELPQEGVAVVRPGQGVKLRFDAFPYQRYGVRFGTVRWLGPAGAAAGAVAGGRDTAVFRALIDLQDTTVKVRGQNRPLLPGMGGRADIVIGRRSLVSFALEPVRALKENLSEPPPSP